MDHRQREDNNGEDKHQLVWRLDEGRFDDLEIVEAKEGPWLGRDEEYPRAFRHFVGVVLGSALGVFSAYVFHLIIF